MTGSCEGIISNPWVSEDPRDAKHIISLHFKWATVSITLEDRDG